MSYEVDADGYTINYADLAEQIAFYKPRLFIAGASAYPREIDFEKIDKIINNVNRMIYNTVGPDKYEDERIIYMVDMAHIAGLVAAGFHQSPIPYADVVTSTTHKTLRRT